jgi:hypothetical protein
VDEARGGVRFDSVWYYPRCAQKCIPSAPQVHWNRRKSASQAYHERKRGPVRLGVMLPPPVRRGPPSGPRYAYGRAHKKSASRAQHSNAPALITNE